MHYTVASNGRVFLALKWSVWATKKDISRHNIQLNILKIQDGGCWHVRFIAFTTILLNRPYRSCRFIYFKASFSCKIHQGKIYKTQRVLVANLATNVWILVASTIILVALATLLGAISCPESSKHQLCNHLTVATWPLLSCLTPNGHSSLTTLQFIITYAALLPLNTHTCNMFINEQN